MIGYRMAYEEDIMMQLLVKKTMSAISYPEKLI